MSAWETSSDIMCPIIVRKGFQITRSTANESSQEKNWFSLGQKFKSFLADLVYGLGFIKINFILDGGT